MSKKAPLRTLSPAETRRLLLLCSLLERVGRWNGPSQHQLMRTFLESRTHSQKGVIQWLTDVGLKRFPPLQAKHQPTARLLKKWLPHCMEKTQQLYEWGLRVATWNGPNAPKSALSCPAVIFFRGDLAWNHPWLAVFNSRKGKQIRVNDLWIRALRHVFAYWQGKTVGWASSWGTLTYELVSIYAVKHAQPLLLVTTHPIDKKAQIESFFNNHPGKPEAVSLTCLNTAIRCDKRIRMVCRDRLLAQLADFHVILEIRRGGNLFNILAQVQERTPRYQWIFLPPSGVSRTTGNHTLIRSFPQWVKLFTVTMGPVAEIRVSRRKQGQNISNRVTNTVRWRDYLYHYTRACPGPWPGESRETYLQSLIEAHQYAEHSALDTLTRIVREKRIRGSTRLVRGSIPVVCWTSRSPLELEKLRKWHRGLLRWTFEPYGIAVKRRRLRKSGGRPAIYIHQDFFARLPDNQQYRYQRHDPPQCNWKYEREWRSPGDLLLREIPIEETFVFVASAEDAHKLEEETQCPFPVVVLNEIRRPMVVGQESDQYPG